MEHSNLKSKLTSLKEIPTPVLLTNMLVIASSCMQLKVIVIGTIKESLDISLGVVNEGEVLAYNNNKLASISVVICSIASLHEILQIPFNRDFAWEETSRSKISSCGIVGKFTLRTVIPLLSISGVLFVSLDSWIAVSYTHLDVYKRQLLTVAVSPSIL